MNLLESVPPNVTSPLVDSSDVVGSKETATKFCVITPCENKLSVTARKGLNSGRHSPQPQSVPVGIVERVSGLRVSVHTDSHQNDTIDDEHDVPSVRSTGPIL